MDSKTTLDKTYCQLLDEAKTNNEADNLIQREQKKSSKELKQILKIEVDSAMYINEYVPEAQRNYRTFIAKITFTNKSSKQITGFKAVLFVKNKKGDVIKKCFIQLADIFEPGVTRYDSREYPIESTDNLFELQANAPDRYNYAYEIKLIIFNDGSRISALK